MGTARRLYLYTVAAVSLLVLSVGLYNLLALVLGEIAEAVGATFVGGTATSGREQVSLAIALVVVGTPVFAIHWALISRGWSGTDDAALADRRSAIRGFSLALAATIALAAGAFGAAQVLDRIFGTIVGAETDGGRATDGLAMFLVAAPLWWFAQRQRNADIRHDHLAGASAGITRFHRYAWTFAGLMILIVATAQLLETLASVLIGRPGFGSGEDWWLASLASSLAALIVGSGLFVLHASDARRAVRDAVAIGEDDRDSALRAAYFGLVMLVALVEVALTVSSSLAELGRWVLGVGEGVGATAFLELVVGPLLWAVPFGIAGWLHWAAQHREASHRSTAALTTAEGVALHLVSGVGAAFLAIGATQLLGRLLELLLGGTTPDDMLRSELAWFGAQIAVGAALWIPSWTTILRRRSASPQTERLATVGRAYLFLILGAALVAGVPSAAFALYHVIDTVLGARLAGLGADLAIPIAVVIVASITAAYHGRLLVSDLRFSAENAPRPGTAGQGTAAVAPVAAEVTVPATQALVLTLRGPVGSDLVGITDELRRQLPPGVTLVDERGPVSAPSVTMGGGGALPVGPAAAPRPT